MRESEIYSSRATACRTEAEAATLHNVRERSLRAGRAWTVMAERALRNEAAREAREAAAVAAELASPDSDRPSFMLRD